MEALGWRDFSFERGTPISGYLSRADVQAAPHALVVDSLCDDPNEV